MQDPASGIPTATPPLSVCMQDWLPDKTCIQASLCEFVHLWGQLAVPGAHEDKDMKLLDSITPKSSLLKTDMSRRF
jgi:hypothetical protein